MTLTTGLTIRALKNVEYSTDPASLKVTTSARGNHFHSLYTIASAVLVVGFKVVVLSLN